MYVDPYDRLAGLIWLMRPCDVAVLAKVADDLVDKRIHEDLGLDRLE